MFHIFAIGVVVLVSYFFGCINGSVMVSHFLIGDDVRRHGSGNAGLTNFYRTYGAKYALAVIAIDMGKTVVATLIGGFMLRHVMQDWTLGILVAGIGCELGHIFPVFFGLKGGKGVLSGGVVVIMTDWRMALVAWGLFVLLWLTTRYVSLGSVCATLSMPVSAYFIFGTQWVYLGLCVLLAGLVVYCHRENIRRLWRHQENKFTWHIHPLPGTDLPDAPQGKEDV